MEIKDADSELSDYINYDRLIKSVVQIYTYQYHKYFEKVFRKVIDQTDDITVYEKLQTLLLKLCDTCKKYKNIVAKAEEVESYIANQPDKSFIENKNDFEMYIERMAIFFYKLNSFIILSALDKNPGFSLLPITVDDYYKSVTMVNEIKKA